MNHPSVSNPVSAKHSKAYNSAGCRDTLLDHGESPASGCRLLHMHIGEEVVQDKELDSGSSSLLVYVNDFLQIVFVSDDP